VWRWVIWLTFQHLLDINNNVHCLNAIKTRKHRQSYWHANPRQQQHMPIAACVTSNHATVTVFVTVWPWPLTFRPLCQCMLSRDGRISDPDPAGFPLSGQIRLRPDCTWHTGSDFRVTIPVIHSAWCHCTLTVCIAAKICQWSPFDVAGMCSELLSDVTSADHVPSPPPFVDNATDQQVPSVDTFIGPSLRPSNWPWFQTASPWTPI